MNPPAGKILFDFDGTLAHRPGMWGQCLLDVLTDLSPGHLVTLDHLRTQLRDGFPWHRPEQAHPQLTTADLWWEHLDPFLLRTFEAVGVADDVAAAAVRRVRPHYCDPARFHLFPETTAALSALKDDGWELVILSNHVPELPSIVQGLGLGNLIDEVVCSASMGYEKPRPEAFHLALGGAPTAESYMVGDNPEADILGAERVGLRAILVGAPPGPGVRSVQDLSAAVELIRAEKTP